MRDQTAARWITAALVMVAAWNAAPTFVGPAVPTWKLGAQLDRQVTIRMGTDIIDYFKAMAEEMGSPYQNLINLYLRDCVHQERKLRLA